MRHAVESLLGSKEDLEILIIDDGSKDDTAAIGDALAEEYPDTIRCIHQENGGHGEAVNTGLKNATGTYYKVLDSDDWFDAEALNKVVETLKSFEEGSVDMMIVNYVYDKPSEHHQHAIRYRSVMPGHKIFHWRDLGHFLPSQNILMHSVIYRTEVLRNSGLQLPKHTFYVDNLFVYEPLPYVDTMYYLDVDLYHYYIGREDQSVNEKVMIGRIDQQIAVNKRMIDAVDIPSLKSRKLRNYLVHYLTMITVVTTSLCVKSGTPENLDKRRELWNYMRETKPEIYKLVYHTAMGFLAKPRGRKMNFFIRHTYDIARKIFSFN